METACGELLIKCPDLHRDCCEGPCCSLLTHYQDAPHDTKKMWSLNLPINLPKLGEVCNNALSDGFQCDDYGVARSTRCKYNGAVSADTGYLLGECRVNTGHYGCRTDADCYQATDVCEQGVCSTHKSLLSGVFSNARNQLEKQDMSDIGIFPDNSGGNQDLAGQEHSGSVNGHLFRSELDLKLSVQAQIMIFGIVLIVLVCLAVQARFMYKRWRWNATKNKRSVDMHDYELDMDMGMDMDMDLDLDIDMCVGEYVQKQAENAAAVEQPLADNEEQERDDNVQIDIEPAIAAAAEQAKDDTHDSV